MLEAVFTLGSAVIIMALGLLVIYNSYRDSLRRIFLGFCVSMSVWQVAFFLSERQSEWSLLMNRATFIGPILGVLFFYLFTRRLGRSRRIRAASITEQPSRGEAFAIATTLVACVVSFTPLVVSGTRPRFLADGEFSGYDLDHGVLYLFYIALVLVIIGMAVRGLRKLQDDPDAEVRQRSNTIVTGVISAAGIGIATNIVAPVALKTSEYSYLGSLAVLTLAVVLTIAIAKHKLINVQLVVARSFAYLLSVLSIAVIYLLVIGVGVKYLLGTELSFGTQALLGIVFVTSAVSFKSLKALFDKLTNKVFYQDAYEAQELYDRLNGLLVSTLDIDRMLLRASHILGDNLRAQFCLIALRPIKGRPQQIVGTQRVTLRSSHIDQILAMAPKYHRSVIIAEDVGDDDYKSKDILEDYNIAALVRLTADAENDSEGLGYIILGPKKSGNPYTNQDVRVLDTVANELIIAIQNALHFEEIQKFNVTLQQRVEDATRKLRRTNAKLEALDETKDDFISMASHQLRTPLTSVKGYISMVLDGDAGDISPTQRKMLAQAFISSQRMVFLIADLLNVSRLKTGKFIIERAPVNLAKLVAEEVAPLVETAQARGIKLTYAKPTNFPTLMIDETKTRQVVMNFVDNAIYYTRAGGHIDVQLVDKPSTVELKVVDNGIGVPKAEQHHLFTKFYRARNAQKARPDGTGLGLFMAKKVILGQGGAIIFESHEGKGSVFGFTFAKSRLQVAENPVDNSSTPVKQPLTPSKKLTQKA